MILLKIAGPARGYFSQAGIPTIVSRDRSGEFEATAADLERPTRDRPVRRRTQPCQTGKSLHRVRPKAFVAIQYISAEVYIDDVQGVWVPISC